MPPIHRFRAPVDVLNYEIVQEQAAALGRLGRGLEAALADLREFDATHPRSEASPEERQTRRTLVAVAGEALWMFVVQRECCGAARQPRPDARLQGARGGAGADGSVSG